MNNTPAFSDKNETDADKARRLLASLAPQPAAAEISDATKAQFADPTEASLDLDALIAMAREELSVKPTKAEAGTLEAPNAEIVNTLVARADQLKKVSDAATKEREKIKTFLKDLVTKAETKPGEITELTVHGAPVFTYKGVVSRVLNQEHIKSLFPDIPENAEMWKDQDSRRAEFK